MKSFPTYVEAKRYAEEQVRAFAIPHGIEKMAGTRKGEIVFSVKMLPNPENRCGWELRCEVLEPSACGITQGMARMRAVPKAVTPELAETSTKLRGELSGTHPAALPEMRENPRREAVLRPGWDRIVETIIIDDPWPVYEQLEAELKLGDRRTDAGSIIDAIDRAETNMRLAHRLYATAEVEHRRWRLDNTLIHAAMYQQSTAALQAEKDAKTRNKAITDEDVTNMAVVLFPDEYQAQEVRKVKTEMMVKSMKNLVEAWTSRCFSLKALKEDLR